MGIDKKVSSFLGILSVEKGRVRCSPSSFLGQAGLGQPGKEQAWDGQGVMPFWEAGNKVVL